MNFHPFYQNKKEVCQKTEYFTNYWTATFPENIFSQSSEAINQVYYKLESISIYIKLLGKCNVSCPCGCLVASVLTGILVSLLAISASAFTGT